MKVYSSNAIRNVAVLGHSGSGKTTVVEDAANAAGLTTRIGKVDEGNTISDYDPEEVKRRVSISSSIVPMEWKNTKINFIDVPGYFDFVGEAKQALRVADMALITVSGKSGVEVGTEKSWEYAEEMGIPKMIFVNGMDDENADFEKVIEELKSIFGNSIAPIQVPFKENGKFVGFVNAITKEAFKFSGGKRESCEIPADMVDEVDRVLGIISEAVAETDDALMEKFFAEDPFTVEELQNGIKVGLASGAVTPVLCGSAAQSMGVRVLLNAITELLPPASELCKSAKGINPNNEEEIEIACDDSGSLTAFVFKTIADPYVGRLSLFRVYSGVMKKDAPLYNPRKDVVEKAGRIFVLSGKDQIEVSELHAGDIGALAKLTNTATQDTLCAKEKPIILTKILFPVPLYSMSVVPKGKGDEDKIAQALVKMREEDKTLKLTIDPETKETVISGIGDTQLDILVAKLRAKYKLEVELVTPIVPYREMLRSKIKVQGKHKKQSGGHGQYGDVTIEFEPSGDPAPYIFEEKIVGGVVPRGYFPAVEKGIQECVKSGPIAGYPVVGIKATLVFGSYHDVDSSEMAFKLATAIAFKEAFAKGKSAILEPIAKVDVYVPDDYTGDIMGDMNKRRGRILGMGKKGNKQVISAEVPMSEMFKYPIDLRSMTQSRGEFTMVFDRYEEAPADVQQKVIETRKRESEADK